MMLAAQRSLFTGSFNPLSLQPALWLSDTGSNPAQWDDLSGNGRHATQATAASQPAIVTGALNGRQVRRFDGVNDWLGTAAVNIPQPYTSYAVFQSSTTSSLSIVLRGASLSTLTLIIHRAAAGEVSGMNAGTLYAPFPTNTSWQIFGTLGNGSNSQAYRNGIAATSGNAGTNAVSSFGVGVDTINSNFFNGYIAEILVFPNALSTENRRRIEGYLASKYAISIS